MKLKTKIDHFLNTKALSSNSKASYTYDLKRFSQFFEDRPINATSIDLYRKQLGTLAPSAQKRKISAINQFLFFLYKEGELSAYYKLTPADQIIKPADPALLRDFSSFYGPIHSTGQFLAILILETGLTPAEIHQLHASDFNWRFNLLEITTKGVKRAISLQNKFAVRAKTITNMDELFTKSRQYIHSELKKFTPYTARELREQYILRLVKKEGKSSHEVAQLLGLKTVATLEKYYQQ